MMGVIFRLFFIGVMLFNCDFFKGLCFILFNFIIFFFVFWIDVICKQFMCFVMMYFGIC